MQQLTSLSQSSAKSIRNLVGKNIFMIMGLLAVALAVLAGIGTARFNDLINNNIEYELHGFLSYGADPNKDTSDLPHGLLPIIYIRTEKDGTFNPHSSPLENVRDSRYLLKQELPYGFSNQKVGDNTYRIKRDCYSRPLSYYSDGNLYHVYETVFIKDITLEMKIIKTVLIANTIEYLVAIVIFSVFNYFFSKKAVFHVQKALDKQRKFAADASHELRNPLATMQLNLELLKTMNQEQLDDPETEYSLIQAGLESSEKMKGILNDLLMIARADSTKKILPFSKVDIDEVLLSLVDEYQTLVQKNGLALVYGSSGPCVVWGDETLLRKMFKVVIDNAVLYTQPKGTIHISITQDASSYCLTIADSGIGMDEEDINLVRNRFYRSRTGQAVNPNGSGLGIPIAIDVAEKHGIEMLIESAIGKGTTVSFIGNKVALTMGDKTASSMGDKMASTIGDKVASTDGDRLASSIENEVVSSMGDKTASNTGDTAASSMGDKASSREV